jgi:hypothetical protein
VCALQQGILTVGRNDFLAETHICLDGLADAGVIAVTYKIGIMTAYCKVYPHYMKEIIDSGDGNFKGVPRAAAVEDSEVLPVLSTFLPEIGILDTLRTRVSSLHGCLPFCCCKALLTRCIIGMQMFMDMGPAIIGLAAGRIFCPSYDAAQIPCCQLSLLMLRSLFTWFQQSPTR